MSTKLPMFFVQVYASCIKLFAFYFEIRLLASTEFSKYTNKKGPKTNMCHLTRLFHLFSSETMTRELGFIISSRILNNIVFAGDTVLVADMIRKLQEITGKVVIESKKKGISIKDIFIRRNSRKWELEIGYTKIYTNI